ncbi:hypothetical protein [Arenimonas sp. MALMAid1274]|uniref:hypothetical protein n=1 Tax=Arenimonas sp. MALMAid1274 TaxID=3411630 RepID=UPI003B9E75B2
MTVDRPALALLIALALAACSPAEPEAPASAAGAPPSDATDAADAAPAATPATEAPAAAASEAAPAEPPAMERLVHTQDTFATLQARLGAGNVVAEVLPGAEGETHDGWILFPDDPTRRLRVYLDDQGEHPSQLVADAQATAWQRADGVRIGMDSNALETLNGTTFGFHGFGWDYGGAVVEWGGGTVAPDGDSAGSVTLCAPEFAEGAEPPGYPIGDAAFASDLPVVRAHPPVVCEFSLTVMPEPA